ncbi:hypothetical protein D9758_005976 [Tetrapyrgos nigripes]|uniref:DUF7330 domain-containing protein n=1 Tax=Tetrapyrgos nigripes TaxID=182062 RepID=A0A8H5G057_9AGAR|nr:hypothetical protein D9758_005976 [Tetrapyrgos nigripes]
MIVPPSLEIDTKTISKIDSAGLDTPPPPYVSLSHQIPSSSKPSNFVTISRRAHNIKGSFNIDPSLRVPISYLPALAEGEKEKDRQNLRLESKNLNVQAEVYVLSRQPLDGRQKVTLTFSSSNGSVTCRVRRGEGSDPPIVINATSRNGSVVAHIPRSFHGLITATTRHGARPKLSESVMTQTTTFGNDGDVSRYYVGEYDAEHLEKNIGDELVVESRLGGVRIFYDEEEETNYLTDMIQSARRFAAFGEQLLKR